MREITKEMIKLYNIKKLGYDFMGYTFRNINELSFHHLIVPKRDCKKKGLGEGYLKWKRKFLLKLPRAMYMSPEKLLISSSARAMS